MACAIWQWAESLRWVTIEMEKRPWLDQLKAALSLDEGIVPVQELLESLL